MSNEAVVEKLRHVLNPKTVTDKLDTLTEKNSQLNERLDKKDEYIVALKVRLFSVKADLDQIGHYSRRTHIRFSGIRESKKGKTSPASCCPLRTKQWESQTHSSHCKRRHSDRSSALTAHADVVIRARRRLRKSDDGPTVNINEDMIGRRAALAKKTRQLKKSRKINDCWTFNRKGIVKTKDGVVKEIRSDVYLTGYCTCDAD